jgi:hypothetical protein
LYKRRQKVSKKRLFLLLPPGSGGIAIPRNKVGVTPFERKTTRPRLASSHGLNGNGAAMTDPIAQGGSGLEIWYLFSTLTSMSGC